MPIARRCKDVEFDIAAIKAVFSMRLVAYNLVPKLFHMYCDVLLQIDCIWSLCNLNIFLGPPNFEAVMHEWLHIDLVDLIIPIDK